MIGTKEQIRSLVRQFMEPVYLYSEEILRDRAKKAALFLEGTGIDYKMHYSTKANNNLTLLKIIKSEGLYVDAMSLGELAVAKKAGFTKDQILYVCNNVTMREMVEVASQGILMVFDSVSQLEVFGEIPEYLRGSEVMLRIDPGEFGVGSIKTAGEEQKFGIREDSIEDAKYIARKYGLKIVGIHQHLGTSFLTDEIDTYIDGVKAGLNIIKENFPGLRIIDLGGGFGIPYKPEEEPLDWGLLREKLVPVLLDFQADYGKKVAFKFEPGRSVVAESGVLLGVVTAVKEDKGNLIIGTTIGMGALERPSRYDAYHEVEIITDDSEVYFANATIVGPICESGDILAKDRKVLIPNIGDAVVVYDVGAYGYSMSSNYTSRPRSVEVLCSAGGEFVVIRKEETVGDMLRLFPDVLEGLVV